MIVKTDIENGELLIRTPENSIIFRGKFDGISAVEAVVVPNMQMILVLLDRRGSSAPWFKNLILTDFSGNVLRAFDFPGSYNAYTGILVKADGIVATTWNGTIFRLDMASGKVCPDGFSK